MKLLTEFINWVNGIKEVQVLSEDKGHMDHPEDMVILGGLPGYTPAASAVKTMSAVAKNSKAITVKFDGYPALVFGSGPDGKFTIMDKHMFNRGAERPKIYSPEAFAQYEAQRGEKGRAGLVSLVEKLWPLLKASYNGPGWYMADLLFGEPLTDDGGYYKFRPNPNGILYQVQADSDLGKYLAGKQAGLAVHRWLDPQSLNTEDGVTWLNDLGNLKPSKGVALIPVRMPVAPKIQVNAALKSKAEAAAGATGNIAQFISGAPQTAKTFANHFTVYLNERIVSKNLKNLYTDFLPWFEARLNKQVAGRKVSQKMASALVEYVKANLPVVKVLFKSWIDIYNYKMDIVKQLDKASKGGPIRGYLKSGQESQEGYVYGGLKFVDRLGFSAQNLALREAKSGQKKYLVIYPGGFHPFHLGHSSVYQHLLKKFPGADVYVAATDTQTERPFKFQDKKFLAGQSGVPANRFVQVKSPYQAKEITSAYDPENTVLVFAVSEKDSDRFNFAPKKDGSPSYFQPFAPGAATPLGQHGYIYVVPKIDFKVAGKEVDSASKIRAMYSAASDSARSRIAADLYPGSKKPDQVKAVLDATLGGLSEADNPNYFGGSSQSAIPGTPQDLMPGPSPEDVEHYHKEMAELKRFMGHR